MATVLFTHSYFLRFDPKQWKMQQPYPPLGTLYAAAVLRSSGHQVSLWDSMFANTPDELFTSIEKEKPQYLVIYDDGFNYLTKMCLTNMREAAFNMITLGKQAGCKVIISSSDATDHYNKYLDQGADFIIIGEGEQTLQALVNTIEKEADDIKAIPGLVFRKEEETIRTAPRDVLRTLDELPFPAWDLVNIEAYKQRWIKKTGYFSLNMTTTRGCPYKCNWCAKPIYGNRYNSRSPEHVVQELQFLIEHYSPSYIWFCDDIFGLKSGWVNKFATLIKREDIKIKFKIQSRADLLLQENNIAALARAGCDTVWLGAESGSQKILDAMDKSITVEQIYKAAALLKKHDIKPSFFLQFGYLGETMEDITQTINMVLALLPHDIGISVSYPLPDTLFYEKVKNELNEKANWTDSDELALMFTNTFSPLFYKKLHRYVHKNYRKHQGFQSLSAIVKNPFNATKEKVRKALSTLYYIPATAISKYSLNH